MDRRTYLKHSATLLGCAISAGTAAQIFAACEQEAKANLAWTPIFFSNAQANTVAELADTILPATATPGAKDIGVPQFIDSLLAKILDEKGRKEFLAGLEEFDKTCKQAKGKSFVRCSPQEREAFLLEEDKNAPSFPLSMWGITLIENPPPPTFFRQIKDLTLFGYFSSETIAKEHLVYDPYPGALQGCMPWDGGNLWSGD
jgi:hypothetical protein